MFYFWAGWKYFLFLLGTIIITYSIDIWLGYLNDKEESDPDKNYYGYKRFICILGVVIGAGVLLTLKYLNFFASSFVFLFLKGQTYNPIDLIVPVGISFYTCVS